jgi:hypothetical protein
LRRKNKKEEEGTEQRHTLRMSKWDLVGMVGADLKHPANLRRKNKKEEDGTEQRHTLRRSKWDLVRMVVLGN